LACGIALAAPVRAEVSRPENIAQTLEILADAYRASGSFDQVTVDANDMSISVTTPDGGQYSSFPDNLHQLLLNAPDEFERKKVLDSFVASLVERLAAIDAPQDVSRIVPVVRAADFGLELAENGPVSDAFVGDLRIYYAFDNPRSISYVNDSSLVDLGLSRDQLADLAAANVAKLGWTPEIDGDGIWFLVFDGNYEATFLLDEAMWTGLDVQLDRIIMMALSRDLVMFSDAAFDGAEAQMRAYADQTFQGLGYPLSNLMFEWGADGWQVREEAR
jgi:uncharacterized protein YtpQ (UPF0354 family)